MKSFQILAFILFTSISSQLFAQEFKGVIILGASAAQIDGDDLGGFDKAGFQVGAGVSFPISEKFLIQPEMMFSQKGSKARKNEPYFNWQLNYIDMPLMVNYIFNDNLDFQAGLGFNYLLSAKFDSGYGFVNRTEAFNKIDFAGNIGVEYHFTELISANIRLTTSLANSGKNESYYNRTLNFTVRYHLLPK
ncbi:porin family protein [Chondrinema litorale]|uniref:porin family protein n=1 Tax=Chondrinema litorale TaxID=2994555 RepID=UPI002542B0AD|nr:porin family protein [Chondrinema litorale]UZR92464.1 porin family protein [Chondrinema litorale]